MPLARGAMRCAHGDGLNPRNVLSTVHQGEPLMYSHQMLRAHHDEWMRSAEARRLAKQLAAASPRSARRPRQRRRRLGLVRGLGLRHPVSHARATSPRT